MNIRDEVKKRILKAAKKYSVEPHAVSASQFWSVSEDIKEWQVRKRGGFTAMREALFPYVEPQNPDAKAKILIFDIETAPIIAHVWGLWDNNVALNQIVSDWHILSWSAKWLGDSEDKVMYMDQRNAKNIEDDKDMLIGIWALLDEADIVITQNGKKFDVPKLNARFVINDMKPPSSFRHIDTLTLAKKHFAFTSNKLEYMTGKLCTKYKKLTDRKFSGHSLWTNCLAGNKEAWNEMEKYNKYDVLALEELYNKLIPWDNSINFNVYTSKEENTCKCGNTVFTKNGYHYTAIGKYQRYLCKRCGAETRDRQNLLTKSKKASLKR